MAPGLEILGYTIWRDPTCFTCSAGAEVAGDAQVHPSIPCHREMSSRVCCTWCRPQFGEGTFWATWADWEMRLGGCFEVTFLEIWKVRPHLKTPYLKELVRFIPLNHQFNRCNFHQEILGKRNKHLNFFRGLALGFEDRHHCHIYPLVMTNIAMENPL